MNNILLYHGSPLIIEKPELGKGKLNNDYGQGFYCTEHLDLAKEWSCGEDTDGYANRYELATEGLQIFRLSDASLSILSWLAILMENRKARLTTPISRLGRAWLIENFLPSYKDYDLIIGYRADDSYFSFARSFLSNEISLSQLVHAMRLGTLGEQFVLKTQKAFNALSFCGYELADNKIYYERRVKRDAEARAAYYRILETNDLGGIFMRDILREEMKSDDPRLR